MAESTPTVLTRIESKIDKLADLVADLSNRVTRLETSESSRSSETDRRFADLDRRFNTVEMSIGKLGDTQDNQAKTIAEAEGMSKTLKWLLAGALGLGGVGTASGIHSVMQEQEPAARVTTSTATYESSEAP